MTQASATIWFIEGEVIMKKTMLAFALAVLIPPFVQAQQLLGTVKSEGKEDTGRVGRNGNISGGKG